MCQGEIEVRNTDHGRPCAVCVSRAARASDARRAGFTTLHGSRRYTILSILSFQTKFVGATVNFCAVDALGNKKSMRLACAPLAYAALLVALTSARRDEDQNAPLQATLDIHPRRTAHAPERRFSVAELEERQRSAGATIQYVDDPPSRSAVTPKLRYSDESSVVGSSLSEPTMKRVRENVQRCGFTWDDAAAKCGRPCPYGLVSECVEKAAPLPPNSSWSNSTYGCYVSGHHSNM